jgi:hypothetical protein
VIKVKAFPAISRRGRLPRRRLPSIFQIIFDCWQLFPNLLATSIPA